MSVSLQLHQLPTIQPHCLYRVKNEILAATGVDSGVFVYKTATQKFSHYATFADMETWPNLYEAAVQAGKPFYRAASVQRDWTTIKDMKCDLTITVARLQALLNDVADVQGSVLEESIVTLTAGA